MKKITEIAKLLNYKNWEEIKSTFIIKNKIPLLTAFEKELLRNYKNINNKNIISFLYLLESEELYIKNKNIFIKPDTIETIKINNKLILLINKKHKTYISSVLAYYTCIECNKKFKVCCNFQKWVKYFHGPVCKSCKKKLVTKTDSYWSKYKKSMNELYGIDFPYQSKKIQQRFKKTMKERYGVEYSGQSKELLLKSWKNTLWKYKISKKEIDFAEKLISIFDVSLQTSLSNNRPRIKTEKGYKYPDVIYKDKIIEFFGDYWHGNPKIYNENKILPNGKSVKEIWEKDLKRIRHIEKCGYKVLIVWENDWDKDKKLVLLKIKEFIYEK